MIAENVVVEFLATNNIKITRQESGGGTTVMSNVTLPSGYTFGLAAGMGDTPDGYGNSAAVGLGGAATGTFLGDGTLVNGGGILLNGSVFTIGSGNGSARAITLSGASGRMHQYWIKNGAWAEEN